MRFGTLFALLSRLLVVSALFTAEPGISATKVKKDKAPVPESNPETESPLRPGFAAGLEISFPHVIDLGFGWMQPKGQSHFGSFGVFERDLASGNGVRDIKIRMQHVEYRFRSEPSLRHPLFWQIAGGYQEIQVDGTRTSTITQNDISFTTDIEGSLLIRSLYYTPKVGVTKHFSNGLSLSWGFGFLIPALVTSDFTTKVPGDPLVDELLQQLGSYRDTKNDLERIGKRLGQLGIPHVDIIDLAWRF